MPSFRHPTTSRRRRAATLAFATLLAAGSVSPALMGSAAAGPTTTSSTTSSNPDPTGSSTTTTAVSTTSSVPTASTTTSATTIPANPPIIDVVSEVDATPEAVPITDLVVPPRVFSSGGSYGAQASRVIRQQLRVARAEAVQIQARFEAVTDQVQALLEQKATLQIDLSKLTEGQVAAIRELQAAEKEFEDHVADAFIRGNVGDLSAFFQAADVNQFVFSNELTEAVAEADVAAMDRLLLARRKIDDDSARLAHELRTLDDELTVAQEDLARLRFDNQQAQFALRVFAAGGEVAISGFVFPVGTPNQFGPSFGAPRMTGTQYEHAHQGTDILAEFGTPLFASERGLITSKGSDVLGGQKLWLKGESGTDYYYAHLQGFEIGIETGSLVEAGAVVGFVGDTGNAKGGVPHLHFEIHPGGGPAIDPYPLLAVVADLDRPDR